MKTSLRHLALGLSLLSAFGCSAEVGADETTENGANEVAGNGGGEETGTQQEALIPVPGGGGGGGIHLCGSDLAHTYLAGFGRSQTYDEEQYWCSRTVAWADMERYFKDWLKSASGRADQQATIQRVYGTIYGRSPSANELNYWMQSSAGKGFTFSEMATWLADYARSFAPVTGYVNYWCWGAASTVQVCQNMPVYRVTPG